ncbi:MAG: LysM peptidoglycan-binding domain-containing M23 family metallopeptidase [Actinomycetia bacterium]|nr:LysM peptidoglycan-binding domain-containing M23 family metallopeptidase [Actinomycetes bacterium]
MPAKGQHRKPHLNRLTRVCIAAGVGSAAIALPLVAATGASAATPAKAPVATTAHVKGDHKGAHAKAETYTVLPGDTLSKIAAAHHIKGGWHRLYHENEKVIGSDPNVIRPGMHLTLHGWHGDKHAAKPAAKSATKPAAKPAPAKSSAQQSAAKTTTNTTTATTNTAAASTSTKAAATTDTGWTKPVGNAAIGTPYHQAGSNWSSGYHTGVDFLVWSGTPVHSVAAGTVVHAGADGAYGNDVIIKHADGKYTLYGHLTRPLVSAGQTVTEGQEIGISGATGNVTGPHLHFEVRTTPNYGSDIDPVAYLASHGVSI